MTSKFKIMIQRKDNLSKRKKDKNIRKAYENIRSIL